MTERKGISDPTPPAEPSHLLKELQRIIPGSARFSEDIASGTISREKMKRTVRLLDISEQKALGIFIIKGVAPVEPNTMPWSKRVRNTGLAIFPLFNFFDMNSDTLNEMYEAYIQGVQKQKEATDYGQATAMLKVGYALVPHVAVATNSNISSDLVEKWESVVANKDATWQPLFERAKILARRTLLLINHNNYMDEITSILQNTLSMQYSEHTLKTDSEWLKAQGFNISRKNFSNPNKNRNIENNRQKDDERRRELLRLFYQGLSSTDIKEAYGVNPNGLLSKLRREGVIVGRRPKQTESQAIYARKDDSAEALAEEFGLSIQTIQQIWELPEEVFQTGQREEIPPAGTIADFTK